MAENGFGASQNVDAYLDYAKDMRSQIQGDTTARSFAIIPDIVAIDIYSKYKIDVHAEDFGKDISEYKRLKKIIQTDYPALMTGGISNRFSVGGL